MQYVCFLFVDAVCLRFLDHASNDPSFLPFSVCFVTLLLGCSHGGYESSCRGSIDGWGRGAWIGVTRSESSCHRHAGGL